MAEPERQGRKGVMAIEYGEDSSTLQADMVIVDEASMLDLLLANHLLKAIPPEGHLLLVGDVDQLPSVGAGNVLCDVIDSGLAAVVRLAVRRPGGTVRSRCPAAAIT